MSAPNVSEQMVDNWTVSRNLIAAIAAAQDQNLCFACQERTYFTKVCGVGICRPCERMES
jgi:hypothetical protein